MAFVSMKTICVSFVLIVVLVATAAFFVLQRTNNEEYIPPPERNPIGRFEETVHVTQARILTYWMDFDEGRNENDNWWTDAYYEHLNIRLTNLFTAPMWGADFDMMVNLAFATGNLPDIMPLYTSLAVRAIEGELVMDLTEIFERYASDQVKALYAQDPRALEAWTFDGRLMGLPQAASMGDFSFFWIPASLLNILNNGHIPQNFYELNALAASVRDYTGGYAIGMDKNLQVMEFIMPMFGATSNWIEDDGKLVWGRIMPEMRLVWQQLADWYAEGILAVDFAVKTQEDVTYDFAARRMGLMPEGSHLPNGSAGRSFIAANPQDDLVAIPIMRHDGQSVQMISDSGYNNVLMISVNAENPDAIMRMFNLTTAIINEGENRPEWVINNHWETSPEGNMEIWNSLATGTGAAFDMHYNPAISAMNALQSGVNIRTLYDTRAFRTIGAYDRISNWLLHGMVHDTWEANWALWNMTMGSRSLLTAGEKHETGHIVPSPRWGAETTSEAAFNAGLAVRFVEFATIAIMDNDVYNQFDEWLRFFYANGGDEINREVNEWWRINKREYE